MNTEKQELLFRQGLEAFNSARFFEAHEFWEEVWLEAPAPDKAFLQGLIQIAAGLHHYTRENRRGAKNLLEAGLAKLEPFPREHWGLELEPYRAAVHEWLAALTAGDHPSVAHFPRIQSRGRKIATAQDE